MVTLFFDAKESKERTGWSDDQNRRTTKFGISYYLNVIFRNAKIDIPFVYKYVIIRITSISITNLLYYF